MKYHNLFLSSSEFGVTVYKYSLPPLEIYTCSLMSSSERRWWNKTKVGKDVLFPAPLKRLHDPSKAQLLPFLSLPVWSVELKRKQKLFPNPHELPHTNLYLPLGSWILLQITSVENSFSSGCANPDKYLRCRYLCCKHLKFGDHQSLRLSSAREKAFV